MKKLLAGILVLTMLFSMVGTIGVFAEPEEGGLTVTDKITVVFTDNNWYTNGLSGSSFSKSGSVDQNVWNSWHGTAGCKVYADGFVKFEPNIKEAGTYDVYYYVKGLPDEGDKSSQLEISIDGAVETKSFNSQAWTYDHWEIVGTYSFPAGKDADKTYVKTTATTSQATNPKEYMAFANAVAFVPAGEKWPRTSSVDTELKRVGDNYFKQIDMSMSYNKDYFSGLDVHDASDGTGWAYAQITKDGVDLAANPNVVIEKSGSNAVPGLAEYPVPFQFGSMERYAVNTLKCAGNGNWKTAYVDVEPRKYDKIHVLFSGTGADKKYKLYYQDGSYEEVLMTPDHIEKYGSWFNSPKSDQAAINFSHRISPWDNDAEVPVETQNGTTSIYMSALVPNPDKVLTKIEPHGDGNIAIFAMTGEVSTFFEDEDLQLTDAESVEMAKGTIDFSAIKKDNADADHVVSDLKLNTEGTFGTTISWSSDDAAIAADGKVTPIAFDNHTPSIENLYREVTLTATITKGIASDTKEIAVKVRADSNVKFDLTAQLAKDGGIGVFNIPGNPYGEIHTGIDAQKGADGGGWCLYSQPGVTPTSYTVEGITYKLNNISHEQRNAFYAVGDTEVDIPDYKYEKLGLVAVNGGDVKLTINYTDDTTSEQLTRTIGNWWNGSQSENVITFPHRISPTGDLAGADWEKVTAYAVNIPADATKTVKSVTIANNRNVRILAMSGIAADEQGVAVPLTAPAMEITTCPGTVYTTDALMEVSATVTPDTTTGEYTIKGVTARVGEDGAEAALTAGENNTYTGYVNLGTLAVGSADLVITATYGADETKTESRTFTVAEEAPIANEKNIIFDITTQINSNEAHGAKGIGIFNTKNTPAVDSIHIIGNQTGAEGGGSLIIVPQAGTPLTRTLDGITYKLANYRADRKNAFFVYDGDTTVDVPNKNYDRLGVLLMNGQDTLFRVNYTDGTNSTQLEGYKEADYKFNTNGWFGWGYDGDYRLDFANRNLPGGAFQNGNCYACTFDIPVDSSKVVDSITVVDNLNASGNDNYRTFRVLAMSGIASDNQTGELGITNEGTTYTAAYTVAAEGAAKHAKVIIAAYDASGNLVNVSVSAGGTLAIEGNVGSASASLNVTADTAYVKAYAWESVSSIKPIIEATAPIAVE